MAEGKTLGAKQVATRIGTDAKTFRKFLRQTGSGVGQGRRYDFPEADVPAIAKEFAAWLAKSKAPKTQTKTSPDEAVTLVTPGMKLKGAGASLTIVPEEDDEELELDDDTEPTMDELMELTEDEDDDELEELDFEDEEDDE